VIDSSTSSAGELIPIQDADWTVQNNIFQIETGGTGGIEFFTDGSGDAATISQNYFYRNGEDLSGVIGPTDVTSTVSNFVQFADLTGGDFRLTAATPASISSGGADLPLVGLDSDYGGVARTVLYSLGAFER